MGKVIAVASGNTGKSFFAANVGAILAEHEKRVLIIDTDIGARSLDFFLGMKEKTETISASILSDGGELRFNIVKYKDNKNLHLLPGSSFGVDLVSVTSNMKDLCNILAEHYDYILLDCPAGAGRSVVNVATSADAVIIIVIPDTLAIRDADILVKELQNEGIEKIYVVANRMKKEVAELGDLLSEVDIVRILEKPLLGALSEDERVWLLLAEGRLFVDKNSQSPVARELRQITRRIVQNI